ncbi:MAG: PIN domain-containing protein [Candidatus Thermoplasmatota archaeon]|jgi:predicted nucleic acid-binding protein|nr:PIN domain-containing protein [Candidatus Thermoplasmatota archaeon]
MKLVIDTNRIIASLIKDSLSRQIINYPLLEFITPDYTLQELKKYEVVIRKKAHLTHEEFDLLLALLFEKIMIIPKEEYQEFLDKAQTLIDDINDAPFVALACAIKVDGIWTEDTDFQTNEHFIVFRTKDFAFIF